MGISRVDAYDYLELPIGADRDSIRTSYKRLAQKWYPDKHGNTPESRMKFQQISYAYMRLDTDNENVQMSTSEMFELYQKVFFPKHAYSNGYHSSDDDDDDSDISDDMFTQYRRGETNGRGKPLTEEEIERNASELITEEEKEKRKAEKRRAKKKRRREKKRQEKASPSNVPDRSKQSSNSYSLSTNSSSVNSTNNATTTQNSRHKVGPGGDMGGVGGIGGYDMRLRKQSSDTEAEGFDPSAAFFTQVKNKKKPVAGGDAGPATRQSTNPGKTVVEENIEDLDDKVLRSRQLAIRGNEMANSGHYQAAIDLFTEAIKLDSTDFRFFGNRSYCFDRIQQYDRALKDGERAISLSPDWPKGYFRKGRALAGLKMLPEAEAAFIQVLHLDRNCDDAMQELMRVRALQLTEMGFSRAQADQALQQHNTVQSALDALLAGVGTEWKLNDDTLTEDVYVSDDDDYNPGTGSISSAAAVAAAAAAVTHLPPTLHHHPHHHPAPIPTPSVVIAPTQTVVTPAPSFTPASSHKAADAKMDPNNPEGLSALWVGNVLPEVSQARLQQLFAKYATVTSIRMLPEKYCAFVNLKTKEDAGRAMKHLQGFECAGQQLLIKFPDNPLSNGNLVIRKQGAGATAATPGGAQNKSSNSATSAASSSSSSTSSSSKDRQSGPVNGNECYFWRTTGCTYGTDCHYKHVKQHKGIDAKPWHKHQTT